MILALDGFKKKEVRLSDESRYMNTLILGQKGTGKSDHVLLNMFHQDLKRKDHSLFVFSSKGETSYKLYALAKHEGRRVHIIKPETNTAHINLLAGEEQEVLELLGELFGHAFISEKTDTFFKEINKTLFINGIKVVKRLYGAEATLEDFYDLITNIKGVGRKMVMHFSRLSAENEYKAKENSHITEWFMSEYFNEKGKVFESCISLRIRIQELVDIQHTHGFEPEEEELPDWQKVIKNNEIVIVDTEYLKYKDYASLIGTYLLLKIQKELLAEETADTFIYLDDFQRFYPVATELLEGSHIKNIGVTLFLQDTKQMNDFPAYKNVLMNSVTNLILLERIAIEDYYFYKDQMNAELLNRKRSEIVYKILNKDGVSESTNGMLFADERLVLNYEKYLDHKKYLTKKKKRKQAVKKKKLHNTVEKVEEKSEEAVVLEAEKTIVKEVEQAQTVVEEKPVEKPVSENVAETDETPEAEKPKYEEAKDGFIMVSKVFEQIKREGDGKEYLSPDVLFDDDHEETEEVEETKTTEEETE